jgi:hypothetical protein
MADILKYGNAIRLAQLSADPSGIENGTLYYNTTDNVVKQYVNGGWQEIPDQALTLLGLALNDGNLIVGNGSNVSVAVDTASVGDIDADATAGLTIKAGVIVNADINASAAIALSKLAALTASRALQSDGSGVISASSVTSTELGYVSGVTSAIQTQLGNKQSTSEKGAANGYASLDGSGKVPVAQLPNAIMEYQGTWNATTNSPTLADGAGSIGDVYRVSVAGTQNLGSGNITFDVGDYAILNASLVWEKADTTDAVSSVNSQTGAVVLDSDDISEGSTNLYFTNERAQDAVGTILTDSSSVDFTYNDGANTITAVVLPAGVDHDALSNFVANEHVDHSTVQIATAANTSGLTGGGDITTTRNLSVDINGTTAETSADNADALLIYDNSATALRKMTRANFLSGISVASAGDINESSYTGLANNTANQVITGLAFANGTVRSFKAQLSIFVDATSDQFAVYELMGIQRGADWQMSESFTGDSITGLTFNITTAGQVRASIGNVSGFSSAAIKFRASTLSV